MRRPQLLVGLVSLTLMTGPCFVNADDSDAVPVDYLKQIKPLLTAKCVACHGGLRQKGNLRLDTAKLAFKGGDSGSAIVSGNSEKSPLIEAILGANGRTKMPIDGEELKPEQIELLKRWIDAGAKAPDDEPVADPRDHWAFKKPVRPALPVSPVAATSSVSRVDNPIDAFLATEHERLKLSPLPEADKATLLRRVYLDLIGIPPTRDELHQFLKDDSATAYENVVDRLLESPLHAQRWAKHWMDIWRYSDWYGSRGGNELRNSRRHIWRWRDWIIESLAKNKPYDQMIVEMLAADEVAPGNRGIGRATGYLGRSYYVFNRHVWLQDTLEYTAASFLGLTFKCARCHDHKYDPISQEEYYRFRAFFEPHNVRTDQLVGKSEVITGNWPAGAPPGNKLKDGDDVIFDAELTVPTYLLIRGNEKNPATDNPLIPGVPNVLGQPLTRIEPITLPLESYYPDLRPERRDELIALARTAISKAEADAAKARDEVEKRKSALARRESSGSTNDSASAAPFLDETFATHDSNVWKILSGNWVFEDKKLKLKTPGSFVTIATAANHPQDFKATLKYRTRPGGTVGSVGVFFDMVELKDAQGVYTHVNASSSGVQAFHRKNGAESYPAAGIVATPLKLDEDTVLEISARGQELKIWINGELKLTYAMPVPRQPGRFALWCHAGVAEFHSLKITPFEPTVDELRLAVRTAESEAGLAAKSIDVARIEAAAMEARITADVARHTQQPDAPARATEASRAERAVALAKAELEVLRVEQQLAIVQAQAKPDDAKSQEAIKSAEAKLTSTRAAVEAARSNAAKTDTTYTAIGTVYPTTSTGRRLALARWIASKENPLTARVAVNHLWKRHFGTALVPSIANFGLNGKPPTHPALLDWLAVEFMESGWNMRQLHRLMVTSAAYRRASSATVDLGTQNGESNATAPYSKLRTPHSIDPDNRSLWRANVRRMEAEVVRDSLWSLTGDLDVSTSGPELEPTSADSTPRRSLYFRQTPDDQAVMLELFDGPSSAECFERTESIMPQQALSLANSPLAWRQARKLARQLSQAAPNDPLNPDDEFLAAAFERVLGRTPTTVETATTSSFLTRQIALLSEPGKLTRTTTGLNSGLAPATDPRLRARENLVHVLLNAHDFVTIR